MIEDTDKTTSEAILEHPQPDASSGLRIPVGIALILFILAAGGAMAYASYTPEKNASEQAAAAAASAPDLFSDLSLQAKSAVVIDIKSGKTLFSLNPDAQLPLASLTKVAMVLAVSEVLSPEQVITIPRDTAPRGSLERLGKGEKWRVRDIIDFTLVASSNAGAEILAEAADDALHAKYPDSPEDKATLWRMNNIALELGLEHTYYLNPSGLDESTTLSGGYGTAKDMAKLFAYAASAHPELFAGTTRDGIVLTSANGKKSTSAINTNDAEGNIPGIILGKTGLTDLAGGNLAIVFDVGPAHPVVAVVLGSTKEGRFSDMEKLVETTRESLTTP